MTEMENLWFHFREEVDFSRTINIVSFVRLTNGTAYLRSYISEAVGCLLIRESTFLASDRKSPYTF